MPHPTDKFEPETTLPDPELNPLLNPLLAAHMGRWAEVYFTSPPERRGQAVAELLRELEKTAGSEPAPVSDAGNRRKEIAAREIAKASPAAAESAYVCHACGQDNRFEQKFCGRCGAPLTSSAEESVAPLGETESISHARWSEPEPAPADISRAIEPSIMPTDIYRAEDTRESAWALPRRDLPKFALESEAAPYRYRLYIGVAVALLLAALVYLGWRGTGASGDATPDTASKTIPSAPPEASTTAPANPAPQPSPPPSSTQGSTKSSSAEPKAPSAATPTQSQSPAPANPRVDQAANAQPIPRLTPAAGSPAVANELSGAEELALAERYLKGNRDTARDSREAAQWLWKAVAKGNVSATIALSDLYLRGDGVPKSCDQARLLLDAAARKGGGAAAERLRNLQAFGCQ